MRIAFLCKRRYTGKDVVDDRFGRLYALPYQLARLGHGVRSWCLDYHRQAKPRHVAHEASPGSLEWSCRSIAGFRLALLPGYFALLLRELRAFSPDLLVGASDIPHVAVAAWLARQLEVPYVVDLYDNFESFGQARIPGFRSLMGSAVRNADLVTVVSDPLKRKILQDHSPGCPVEVVHNGVDLELFTPGDRLEARRRLGLPEDAKLIGTAGGLSRMKGVDIIYDSWSQICTSRPDVHLVLAGPVEPRFPVPKGPRIHYLGQLPQEHIVNLFRALDVGIITVADTPFGRYCFPQKAHEMLACSLPIIGSDIGVLKDLLADAPDLLFNNEIPETLVAAAFSQLHAPTLPTLSLLDWSHLARRLEPLLPGVRRMY